MVEQEEVVVGDVLDVLLTQQCTQCTSHLGHKGQRAEWYNGSHHVN